MGGPDCWRLVAPLPTWTVESYRAENRRWMKPLRFIFLETFLMLPSYQQVPSLSFENSQGTPSLEENTQLNRFATHTR